MCIGIIWNNSLVESERTRTEFWTPAPRCVTLHCIWRPECVDHWATPADPLAPADLDGNYINVNIYTHTVCLLAEALLLWYCVCSFLSHMVMMFPYTEDSLEQFDFEGSTVLARSSDDEVHSFYVSYSSTDNQTSAEINLSLDSQGSCMSCYPILFCNYNEMRVYFFFTKTITKITIYGHSQSGYCRSQVQWCIFIKDGIVQWTINGLLRREYTRHFLQHRRQQRATKF